MRETMGVHSGPETIPYLFLATFIVMALATPVYGFIASRFPRRKFLPWVYLFFAINIVFFWAAFVWVRPDRQADEAIAKLVHTLGRLT